MKKTLQFALPLIIPAALLLNQPMFAQGNGRGGNRGNGNGYGRQSAGGAQFGGQDRNMGQRPDMGSPGRQNGGGNRGPVFTQGQRMESGPAQQRFPGNDRPDRSNYGNRNDRPEPSRVPAPDQRDRMYGGGNRGPASPQGQRMESGPAQQRFPSNDRPDNRDYGNRDNRPDQRDRMYGGGNRPGNYYDRNDRRGGYDGRNRDYDRRSYGYNDRGYHQHDPSYGRYPARPYSPPVRWGYRYPYRGQTFSSLSFGYRTIPYGGYNYCYNGGIWYRPYGSIFRVVAPPIGISINILPFGYSRLYVGPTAYYYYSGVYYLPRNNGYEVVDPPLGAKLPALPYGAKEVIINGQRLFEDDGTYYMEEYNINNQRLYTVVGVHGVLNQKQMDMIAGPSAYTTSYDAGLISSLPANCRKVVISGQDYYLSPDDVYYQEIIDGNVVSYQVVGQQ